MNGRLGMNRTIGVIGFGRFGRLAARYLAPDGKVRVWDPAAAAPEVLSTGAEPADLATAARSDIVIPAVPISRFQEVLGEVTPHLKAGSLVVDVCSVKELPVRWMQALLPAGVDILGTHPMFGPDSAADSLKGRKIVLCRVRVGAERYARIRNYLDAKGLAVIESSPAEHDRQIAVSLALTHFIGRALAGMGATPQEIDTEGYKRLLRILEVVENDTWQLFEDMNRFNPHAETARHTFMRAMEEIEKRLIGGKTFKVQSLRFKE
ncbi:MAG: prephenate dehydrogenase/arogenate dehydrogenase family protein [Desulfobacterales bacterium]|jgi:prephenate dehydrogenase|nr:prephenate dehydrogenase/arogenate dehydrogenase family protein [Desulfobacterales bacterium]